MAHIIAKDIIRSQGVYFFFLDTVYRYIYIL